MASAATIGVAKSRADMHKVVIERVVLKCFRSYAGADLRLANPTFIVGRNGAGKSNLLDAFQFLADAMTLPLSAVLSKRGGITNVRYRSPGKGQPPSMAIGVVVHVGRWSRFAYNFELKAERGHGYRVAREQCVRISPPVPDDKLGRRFFFDRIEQDFRTNLGGLAIAPEKESLALPLVGGHPAFAPLVKALASIRTYGYSTDELRSFQDPDAGYSLKRDASNAASVLQEIVRRAPDEAARIGELLEAAVPQTSHVQTVGHGNKLSLQFTQSWDKKKINFDAYSMSDGTLRMLAILLSVFQRESPSLMAIEEPESSLHPGAVGVLLDVLGTSAEKTQLVVTTQSPEVLDSGLAGAENLRLVDWSRGESRLLRLGEVPQSVLREHLMGAGELLRANQLVSDTTKQQLPRLFRKLR